MIEIIKTIRGYTVVLFVLLCMSCTVFSNEVVKPYIEKLNVRSVFHRLELVCGTTSMEPLVILNDDSIINAWTDGTNITITTGLLKYIKNNDELAMVLGHEMGHVLNGDVNRSANAMDARYLEANADKMGAFIMMRAGFDECRGKEIMRTFKDTFGDDVAAEGHPDNAIRLDQLDLPQCDKGE